MRIRGEEHRALGNLLPEDVKTGAVRLNVAAREKGGKSVITSDTVKELGVKGVREVVAGSYGDPTRAARLVAQKSAERVVSEVRSQGEGRGQKGEGRERG
jgi:hypothetical protein